MLEYFFGGGQHRTAQLIVNFQASSQVVEGLAEARRQMSQQLRGADADARRMFQDKYGDATDEQVITKIVDLRGLLHHQSMKRRRTWHPALQKEYGVVPVHKLCRRL